MKKLKSERPDIIVEQFKLAATGLFEFHPCSPEFNHSLTCIMSYKALCETKQAMAEQEEECEDEACNS